MSIDTLLNLIELNPNVCCRKTVNAIACKVLLADPDLIKLKDHLQEKSDDVYEICKYLSLLLVSYGHHLTVLLFKWALGNRSILNLCNGHILHKMLAMRPLHKDIASNEVIEVLLDSTDNREELIYAVDNEMCTIFHLMNKYLYCGSDNDQSRKELFELFTKDCGPQRHILMTLT